MLTLSSQAGRGDCSRLNRRNFLQIGGLGLAGWSLADLLALKAQAGERSHIRDKSVVFLYLGGGPSQIETFDPKMDGPPESRSMTGEVKTSLPGITFGGTFPKLAEMADKLAIVRSFVHGNSNHDGGMNLFTGHSASKGSLGAIYARLAGSANRTTGMPSNVFVSPTSVGHAMGSHQGFYYSGLMASGSLPASSATFHPELGKIANSTSASRGQTNKGPSSSGLLADLQLRLPLEQLDDRRQLLTQIDGLRQRLDKQDAAEQSLDQYQRQAYEVLVKGVSEAFDLSKEDPKLVRRYDTSHFKTPEECIKREKNGKMTAQSQPVLGKQMLLARRLCEAGSGFVTVGMNDWDMHANANSYSIPEGMALMGGAVDHAVSAFLADLADRGLSDKILLVITGEMGRTPRISVDKDTKRPGRDHWANLGALAIAGGGLKMGQVIGASDRTAGTPATAPVTPKHLMATIWHTLFDVGELRVTSGLPADLARLVTDHQPIRELIG